MSAGPLPGAREEPLDTDVDPGDRVDLARVEGLAVITMYASSDERVLETT